MKQYHTLSSVLRRLLGFSPLQYMLDTMEQAPGLAQIYADNDNDPRCCAVLLGHGLWLVGDVKTHMEAIAGLIRRAGLDVLLVYYDAAETAALLRSEFAKVYDNMRSLCRQEGVTPPTVPDGRILPIDRVLLRSDVDNLAMIVDEVLETATYPDLEVFCRDGFGFSFVMEGRVCGFCTSEYQSCASVAIGVEVCQPYQRQGIATSMVTAFLREARRRKLAVYWDCWQQNEPSVRTALACGFAPVADYPVLFIDLNGDL